MKPKPQLKLETTEQFLAMPLVGTHDNSRPVPAALERCLDQLGRISGN